MIDGMLLPGVRLLADGRLIVVDVDAERAFANAVRELEPFVHDQAKRWAPDDPDLEADLAQEAWIKLWELDPLRYDPANAQDQAYVRSMLASHIRDVARKQLNLRGGPETVRLHARLA
jgi:DNA-directed RNA polymerase specialized sigma24 family protein